jgi:hypothetical protein
MRRMAPAILSEAKAFFFNPKIQGGIFKVSPFKFGSRRRRTARNFV